MKYSTFEELPVWNAATAFALKVFELTEKIDFSGLGDTKRQLERSALSISNNIAEGFERGTTTELINFLYIARGSAGESRSMLRLCEGLDRFSNFKSEISNSKQLHGWLESLKNSDIKGVKFLTAREGARIEGARAGKEFDREMSDFRRRHEAWLIRRESDPNAQL